VWLSVLTECVVCAKCVDGVISCLDCVVESVDCVTECVNV